VQPVNPRQANAKEVRRREKIKLKKLFADAFRAVPEGRSRNAFVRPTICDVKSSPALRVAVDCGVLPGQSRSDKGIRRKKRKR